jgi:hypothetical protein
VGQLPEYYTADEIRTWLYAPHPQLACARAIDLISQNRSEDALRILDRLDVDVYLQLLAAKGSARDYRLLDALCSNNPPRCVSIT